MTYPHLSFPSLERRLWYLFLAALPLQTRWILSSGREPFSEWFSVAFWATDALLLFLIAAAALRERRWLLRRADAADTFAAALVLLAALSVARAPEPLLAFVGTLRVAAGVLLYWYVRGYALDRFDPDRSAAAFVIGGLGQAGLGLWQYALQHDVGFRMLGETVLRTTLQGVAVFYDMTGQKILRAYGTLPHPNVLAMTLLLAGAVLLWLFFQHGARRWNERLVWACAGGLLVWGMAATYARTVLAAGASAGAVFLTMLLTRLGARWANIRPVRRRAVLAAVFVFAAGLAFAFLQWPQVRARLSLSSREEAVTLRAAYNREALSSGAGLALRVNWAGVGAANFVPWLEHRDPALPRHLLQPAHNLFLLVYTELGVLGVVALIGWLFAVLRSGWHAWASQPAVRAGLLCIAFSLIVCASLDHFFWTLQQGRLLWWLSWAVIAGSATLHRHG